MGEFSIWHWLIVLLILILLFGARKIPELMRGVGEGIRSFREGINGTGKAKEVSRAASDKGARLS